MFLFEYLGAFYRWVFLVLITFFTGREKPSFEAVLRPNPELPPTESAPTGFMNTFIGLVVTIIIVHLIVKSGI